MDDALSIEVTSCPYIREGKAPPGKLDITAKYSDAVSYVDSIRKSILRGRNLDCAKFSGTFNCSAAPDGVQR